MERLEAAAFTTDCAGGYGRLATVEDMAVEEWDRTVDGGRIMM